MTRRTHCATGAVLGALILIGALAAGCGGSRPPVAAEEEDHPDITVTDIEGLESFDNLLPVPPDSVVRLYRRYDRRSFYREFGPDLQLLTALLDSLNAFLPPARRIDTLAIDHTFANLGNAGRTGRTLSISGSYFYLYRGRPVLRSVVMHEYGHVFGEMLDAAARAELEEVWRGIRGAALFYVFRDGEYSGNAWFGGHPEESPGELFASAFNIFNSRPDELRARLRYVPEEHRELVDRLRTLVGAQDVVLFE